MQDKLILNKNSVFFVALCKDEESLHSFIVLGVEVNKKKILLNGSGKYYTRDSSAYDFLFSSTSSGIKNEDLYYFKKLSYKAYAINFTHYLQCLALLKKISIYQKNTSLKAYCPLNESATRVSLKWQSIAQCTTLMPMDIADSELSEYTGLRLNNTCRHSAINLTQKMRGITDLGQGVSSQFFRAFPSKSTLLKGDLGNEGEYFYILPLPPASFINLSREKERLLKVLYQRLDTLILIDPTNPLTIKKFKKIKKLYECISHDEKSSLLELLKHIEQWVCGHKDLINSHRKSHWITFPTATETMFKEILSGDLGM